jgi:hypothetical protein
MSSVSTNVLPLVVPFFGAAVLIGLATTRCLWRRAQHNYNALSERIAVLERRAVAEAAAPPPIPTVVPNMLPVYNALPQYRVNYYPPTYPTGAVPSAPPMSANL